LYPKSGSSRLKKRPHHSVSFELVTRRTGAAVFIVRCVLRFVYVCCSSIVSRMAGFLSLRNATFYQM